LIKRIIGLYKFNASEIEFFKPLKGKEKDLEKRIKKLLKQSKKKNSSPAEEAE